MINIIKFLGVVATLALIIVYFIPRRNQVVVDPTAQTAQTADPNAQTAQTAGATGVQGANADLPTATAQPTAAQPADPTAQTAQTADATAQTAQTATPE